MRLTNLEVVRGNGTALAVRFKPNYLEDKQSQLRFRQHVGSK